MTNCGPGGVLSPQALVPIICAVLLLVTGGSDVPTAKAADACERFGGEYGYELRNRPARRAVVCLVNKERTSRGVPRLRNNRKLQRAAQDHNDYMVRKGCFAHECAGEGSLERRLFSASYLGSDLLRWSYGENIAWGEGHLSKPRMIVRAWMNSNGHRANILNPVFEHIGVGFTRRTPYDKAAKGATYTTDFGRAD